MTMAASAAFADAEVAVSRIAGTPAQNEGSGWPGEATETKAVALITGPSAGTLIAGEVNVAAGVAVDRRLIVGRPSLPHANIVVAARVITRARAGRWRVGLRLDIALMRLDTRRGDQQSEVTGSISNAAVACTQNRCTECGCVCSAMLLSLRIAEGISR